VCDTSVECATWYLPGTFAVERNTTLVGAEVRETAPSGVISCAVRSEHYSRDPEACTTALQLPFNPQYEGEDTSSIFVSVTGYWLQDIWIIVHGVDSNGVRRAYSSLTNQMGQCVIKVRPGTYSIAPYWTSYPKMSFEPKAVYSVQAEPQGEINVTFISSLELPDPGRGAWIGLSRTFCGWYGELDVDEPTDVVGYRRISNTEWSTIDLTWACMLSGIEPEVVPEGVRTFRNVGQWFFGPYEEKIEGLQYLILFDRREGGEVKAWSLLGEQVDIQPGQTLVIPVMSRPFFTIAREGRRTFLGDVIVSRLSVLVQITTPKVV